MLHIHTRLTALFPGLPRWASTRKVKPIWILLKQETVSGSGISWAICKSAPCSRHLTMPAPHHSVFYRPDAHPATQPTASKHALKAKALKTNSARPTYITTKYWKYQHTTKHMAQRLIWIRIRLRLLFNGYMHPHLYCAQVWSESMCKMTWKCLEKVQRRVIKLVKGLKHKPYAERLAWLQFTWEKKNLRWLDPGFSNIERFQQIGCKSFFN